jgi:outer membrane cobalamin receptor
MIADCVVGFFMIKQIGTPMRTYLTLAGFIALGVTLGYALMSVPNVELVTATVFLGGYVMGIRLGLVGGLVTETIYGLMNPQGMAAPPLLAGMVLAMGITGMVGGIFGKTAVLKARVNPVMLAAAGLICTLNFALLTSLGYFISVQLPLQKVTAGLIAGLPLYFIHLLSNTLIFFIVLPLLIQRFRAKLACLSIPVLISIFFRPSVLSAQDTPLPDTTEPASNYRHLGDLTQTLPGILYRDLGYSGHWAGIRISGMALNQTALMLNGFQLKDPVTCMIDMRWFPVEMIDTMAVIVNMNTPGARAVALDTRMLPTSHPFTRAVYRTGSNRFSDLDLTFGQKYTHRFEMMSGFLLNNEGEESGYGSHHQQIRSVIHWQPWHSLKLSYLILSNVLKSDTRYPLTFPKDSVLTEHVNLKTDRTDHMLRCTWFAGQNPLQLSWNYTRIEYRLRDRSALAAVSAQNEKRIRGDDQVWSLEQRLSLTTLPVTWRITAEQQGITFKTADFKQWQWTATLGTEYTISRHFLIEGMTGYYNGAGSTIFGSAKLIARKADRDFWFGLSKTYRAPEVSEKYGIVFLPTIPENGDELTLLHYSHRTEINHDLLSEQLHTLETGLHWKRRGLDLTLRGFVRENSNIIALSRRENLLIWDNHSAWKLAGIEAGIEAGPWKNIRASLTYNMARNFETRTELERPNLWGRAALVWRHPYFSADLDLQIVLQTQFWSDYYSFSGFGLESGTIYNTGNSLIHGKILARVMKRAIISFAMDNILNTVVFINNEMKLPGRSYRLSYIWELLD